jgi:hypothetical protein
LLSALTYSGSDLCLRPWQGGERFASASMIQGAREVCY